MRSTGQLKRISQSPTEYRQQTLRYVMVYRHLDDGWEVTFLLRGEGFQQGPAEPVTPRWWPHAADKRFSSRDAASEEVRRLVPAHHIEEVPSGRA